MTATIDDITDVLWVYLSGSSLKGFIRGGIYKDLRPVNSQSEDAVINATFIDNEQLQNALVNINLFIPNIELKINGYVNNMPDFARRNEVTKHAIALLKDKMIGSYLWDIESQNVDADADSKETFVNIRLQFKNINI